MLEHMCKKNKQKQEPIKPQKKKSFWTTWVESEGMQKKF
jgi:hypothetical protein